MVPFCGVSFLQTFVFATYSQSCAVLFCFSPWYNCTGWQGVNQQVAYLLCLFPAQVRNLEPGTKYEFRVMAENPQGISDALETDEAILAKLPYGQYNLDGDRR